MNLNFIRNKFYIAGLISGLIITTATVLLVISFNERAPEKKMVKGTMLGNWAPLVGEKGTVVQKGWACSGFTMFSNVQFDNSQGGPIMCHPINQYAWQVQSRVVITNIAEGDFCENRGIFVARSSE